MKNLMSVVFGLKMSFWIPKKDQLALKAIRLRFSGNGQKKT